MNHKFAINPAAATIARFRISNADILASRIAKFGRTGVFFKRQAFLSIGLA